MEWMLYVIFTIIILMLCFIIFTLGRAYELSVEIRELNEKIEEANRNIKKWNNFISTVGEDK